MKVTMRTLVALTIMSAAFAVVSGVMVLAAEHDYKTGRCRRELPQAWRDRVQAWQGSEW